MEKVTALLPMRHQSVRVPGKNYRTLGDKPLFEWVLESLKQSPYINHIVINTDSPTIKERLESLHPDIQIIHRPAALCDDTLSMNKVIAYDLERCPGEYFFQTHSTNPFLTTATINKAIEVFFRQGANSLFSVTRHQTRMWSPQVKPINHNPKELLRTQDLAPMYEENSNFYIFSRKAFETNHNRLGPRPAIFEINKVEATDIDDEQDFTIAQAIAKHRLYSETA